MTTRARGVAALAAGAANHIVRCRELRSSNVPPTWMQPTKAN
eukprot:CAMPEP_0119388804 /NCGR_PEP_ID=MMETSP1334-20130426/106588_1 /TAXON_ID=127549 /ORGANISM="Calcidiscus leptoporus, Strain RCC1130" /LENGTH=41 /DNA_ID= /DNA_START= /DNA_END= /DNA_ORIENTATION=